MIRSIRYCGVAIAVLLLARTFSGAPAAPRRCSAPEYRQFDFWAGDWDAVDAGKPNVIIARCRVTIILDGCALLEQYDQTDGLQGRSFSTYDASRRLWHQSWVTNRGQLLLLGGGMQGQQMVLTGSDGNQLIRGFWNKLNDGVRETAFKSSDGGKSWTPLFDIIFRRHARRSQ